MNISSINPAPAAGHTEPAPPKPLTTDQLALVHAVKAANAAEQFGQDQELAYSFDKNTRQAVVRIVNRKTGEVLQQIPAEYVLRLAEELKRS